MSEPRAGFVALIGPPNVGKSTLLNRLLGEKVSIVSSKPQTTRDRILGILHQENLELVFVDTPGLHKPRGKLSSFMNKAANHAMQGADLIALVIDIRHDEDVARGPTGRIRAAILAVKAHDLPCILLVNKIDRVRKPKLLPFLQMMQTLHAFAEIIPISARSGDGMERVINACSKRVPAGPPMYGDEQLTDQTERKVVSELVREQVFVQLEEELPYASAVVTETFAETTTNKGVPMIRIQVAIVVERDTQKAIVIGKGGARLKEIGQNARAEMEKLLGCKVHLELFVKAVNEWSEREASLRELGYDDRIFSTDGSGEQS